MASNEGWSADSDGSGSHTAFQARSVRAALALDAETVSRLPAVPMMRIASSAAYPLFSYRPPPLSRLQ